MKIYSTSRQRRVNLKSIGLILAFIIPLGFGAGYGLMIANIFHDMVEFSYDAQPDPATFETANYTLLAEMALEYDERFEEYHLPLNICADISFVDQNYTTIDSYDFSDNGALRGGIAILGYTYKYLAAQQEGNLVLQADAMRVLRRLVWGFSMLLAVPNGGISPEYGGILARGWAGPDDQEVGAMFFEDHYKHQNGTGAYSQYRWRGFTSNDEHAGFYLGLAVALKFLPDPEIQHLVRLMVDQICQHMINTNFNGISGNGALTGVDQKPLFFASGGFWIPLLLKLGALCYPEKYEADYLQSVAEAQYFLAATEGGEQETLANYYAYAFGHCVVAGYLLLEGTNSTIGRHYYEGYLQSLRAFTATHRNAYFNALYLLIENLAGNTASLEIIERDVEDQLMRFRYNHFPDVYGSLRTPDPAEYRPVDNVARWKNYFAASPYGGWLAVAFMDIDNSTYYQKPLTVEYLPTGPFMWGRTPFEDPGEPREDILRETLGLSFTVPYWIGRYLGFISPAGLRTPYTA